MKCCFREQGGPPGLGEPQTQKKTDGEVETSVAEWEEGS